MKKSWIVAFFMFIAFFYSSPLHAADLTLPNGGRVTVELISSDAAFRNTLALTAPTAAIATTGCQLEAAGGLGGIPLLSEKQSQRGCRVALDADPATPGIQGFAANTTLQFQFCAQTDADPACEFVWSSNSSANSDHFDHLHTTPLFSANFPGQIYQLAWEDKENGGDQDFNDLIAVVRVQGDADGDGLWDDWEQFGIDTNGDNAIDLNLPALGANPNHRDLFLEIDFMDCAMAGGDCAAGDTHSHRPKAAAIQAVVNAFANAPLTNPDGTTGINLHVDVSNAIAHQNFLGVGCGFGDATFDAVKANPANFGPANPRRFAYHYVLFTHRQGTNTTSSGCAELPGNDFLVSLGEWNTTCIGPGSNGVIDTPTTGDDVSVAGSTNLLYTGPNLVCDTAAVGDDVQFITVGAAPPADRDGDSLDDRTVGTIQQQAGTLMHEFGHNLQLCHGGQFDTPGLAICNTNNKPNYLSVMNYTFQIPGIPPTDPDGAGPLTGRLDYSRAALPNLNENSLNEPAGIGDGADSTRFTCPGGNAGQGPGTGAINWNCDTVNVGTDTSVSVDINADGTRGTLTSFNDWASLRFDFQSTSDFVDGVHNTVANQIELDQFTATQLPETVDLALTKTAAPNPVIVGETLTYTLTVLNLGPGEATTVQLTDTLPADLTVLTVIPSQGSCTQAAGLVTCNLNNLINQTSAQVTITAIPHLIHAGATITNVATVATAVDIDADPANNQTQVVTQVNWPKILVSSRSSATAGDVDFRDEDILAYDPNTNTWVMLFDGSDVGVTKDVDAFAFLPNGDLLLSFNASTKVPGLGKVDDSDIVRFTPTLLGNTTAGSFTWYLHGADVGLTTPSEDIDLIAFTPAGELVVSTIGDFTTPTVTGHDEDLIRLDSPTFGNPSAGAWSLYFAGARGGLANEDINGLWIDPLTAELYLTVKNDFAFAGQTIDSNDIFVCTQDQTPSDPACTYRLFWDADLHGYGSKNLDAIGIGRLPSTFATTVQTADIAATADAAAPDDDLDDLDASEQIRTYLPALQR